ncbi:MAG TPA: ATP-dependent DNA ligase [Candidatus Baltobacteraceae bacterium]|nr:ATP-dependent DNA ligase [Candidatus Baltobacteraceae bacterium]
MALRPPIEPMETRQVPRLPEGERWQYEPKWDGFRCVAFREGGDVELESKSGQSLTRYFPELAGALLALEAQKFVLDGEIFIQSDGGFDFDALLQRIHPAESRVRMLARETPVTYTVFDLLVDAQNATVYELSLQERRERLEAFASRYLKARSSIVLSPATDDVELARHWLAGDVARLDGVIAKRADLSYAFGSRDAASKIKRTYTADCVIGGFRGGKTGTIASLLLGLYDGKELDHVGFVGSMNAADRKRAGELLRPLVAERSFTRAIPGGPSRWRKGAEESEWFPVEPKIVVEVSFDHVTGHRFRHAARLLRWRPDKSPRQCTIEQLLSPK